MKKNSHSLLPLILFLLAPALSWAHAGEGGGFMAGLSHPVLGIDHLLAMLSVGILSAQIGGRAIWTVPATFVAVMCVGGFTGIGSEEISFIEKGIGASVLLLGLAIAFEKNLPILLAMIFVGFFAFFHGYAHGVEMPVVADPYLYAGGFLLGTTIIHLMGVAIGVVGTKTKARAEFLRFCGAFIGGMGMLLVLW